MPSGRPSGRTLRLSENIFARLLPAQRSRLHSCKRMLVQMPRRDCDSQAKGLWRCLCVAPIGLRLKESLRDFFKMDTSHRSDDLVDASDTELHQQLAEVLL